MKGKRAMAMILSLLLLLLVLSPPIAFADDDDDNVDTGEGEDRPASVGKYRTAEWMYKVSVYVGLSDKYDTQTPISGYKLIGEPVYWRPPFPMPDNVKVAKYNKIQYLNGAPLTLNPNPITVIDNEVPRIPITHQGNLNNVKSFFGDTETLMATLQKIAEVYGTTAEALVENIIFNISNQSGRFRAENILPVKNPVTGRYRNLVPWVVVYEPVTIAHFADEVTRIAFTATEYALAQKQGIFNFFYRGDNAQWIANMTHANLPNSLVLERDWFGFRAYPPLEHNVKWSDDRIIAGGGWGMRYLRPGAVFEPDEPEEEPDPPGGDISLATIDIGDYRTDTDVITSFWVESSSEVNPDNPGYVDFYIDGVRKHRQEFVLPKSGSQVVWVKWHTPTEPTTVTVEARPSKGRIQGNSTQRFSVIDLDAYEPPDPRAKDPRTGKVVEKPSWFAIVNPPDIPDRTYAEWSVWTAYWHQPEEGPGWWIYYQNHYNAQIAMGMGNYTMDFKPDAKVPTAQLGPTGRVWEMGSGYGWNLDTKIKLTGNASGTVAKQGNTITYLPEYKYKGYLRLSERFNNLEFKLKHNRYSTFNNRVHFTPLWYPNNKYTIYTRVIDIWTPAGQLYINETDYMDIRGSVLDDYKVVPAK